MGTFMGHVVPGSFFTLFGIWWVFCIFKRYHLCRRAEGSVEVGGGGGTSLYRNTCTFACPCFSRWPMEGLFKITMVIIGITGEFVTAFKDGKFAHLGNAQHMTMFFFFGLNGVVDVLTHYRAPLPPSLDYISACLAFCMEGVLFLYHLHGRTPMDVQLHMLLVYVVGACILCTLAEMYFRKSVMPALARAYFVILQGTWFFQVGYILYPPVGQTWDEHNHNQMMIVTLIFCWHNAAVFVFMLITGWLMYASTKKLPQSAIYQALRPIVATPEAIRRFTKMDSEQVRSIIADSEEDDV